MPARAFCEGCGRPRAACDGSCLPPLEVPRFCPYCGRKAIVQVTPTGYRARCKRDGVLSR